MEGEVSGENPNKDVLRLNGKLQVTTARDALMVTAANPHAVERLTAFLNLHEVASSGTAQNDLTVVLSTESPEDEKMKKDIIHFPCGLATGSLVGKFENRSGFQLSYEV